MSNSKQASGPSPADGMVTIGRTGDTPLRFKGVPVIVETGHMGDNQAKVVIWQCKTGGYVAQLEVHRISGRISHARRVENTEDALAYLESVVSRVEIQTVPSHTGKGRRPVADLAQTYLARSRNLAARNALSQLIAASSKVIPEKTGTGFRDP